MGGGSGCETTASTGSSRQLTSLLSHCSHGGNSFTAETFVNDDREAVAAFGGGRKAIIDKGLSGETRSAMRNDGSHSTVSVVVGLALARPAGSVRIGGGDFKRG